MFEYQYPYSFNIAKFLHNVIDDVKTVMKIC